MKGKQEVKYVPWRLISEGAVLCVLELECWMHTENCSVTAWEEKFSDNFPRQC